MTNYVGSITILDRGDGAAQAVLDRNARSLAKRIADETRDELHQVLNRVDKIYGNFELGEQLITASQPTNTEYLNDVSELEELLKDQVKKKKYQQQITIFIVGYENVCGQKLRLLQQVNDFFMENAHHIDDDDQAAISSPDLEMDDVAEAIDESLQKAKELAQRLAELNKEMVEHMYQYAQAKASNNPAQLQMWQEARGKKSLEKKLEKTKDDLAALSEKLQQAMNEIETKEDKIQQLYKQVELKNMEAQRFKAAAEVGKKNTSENEGLRDEIERKNQLIKDMKLQLGKMEVDYGEQKIQKEQNQQRLAAASDESQRKLEQLQNALNDNQMYEHQAKLGKKMIDNLYNTDVYSI
ncbi:DgyrCDS7212 [Dimorphilus gyrociliatus]|uniref:DgyrCDS7212 n=1 Tax=Dimorphilus gyrociliatus TaxID=2664684 RepID=A0A7I8VS33_9ANNE|nr:DgyrCDS7212 [Dimorphilus gyrociliatus]